MLSLEQLVKIEEVLTAGCEKHLADGGELVYGLFNNGSGGCCPIWSAIDKELYKSKTGSQINLVHFCFIKAVGFSFQELEMAAFMAGFDGLKHNSGSEEMYAMGQKFRETYAVVELEEESGEVKEAEVEESEIKIEGN